MNRYFLVGGLLFFYWSLVAQNTDSIQVNADSIIYEVPGESPRFPACEQFDTTIQAKNACAQRALLTFMNQNIVYPMEARMKNASGMVVVKFVVEKDGSVSTPQILKDVEGGCGLEVLRIVGAMNQAGIRWVPGKNDGKVVRSYFTLPMRFKLEEAPPFTIIGQDSVWVEFDNALSFVGGNEALMDHLGKALKYPESAKDSCFIGKMEVKIVVDRTGKVRVLDMVDLNGLGFDFWYAATDAVTSTIGKWNVATFEGKKVPASYDITISFVPEGNSCQSKVDQYSKAVELVNAGSELYNSGEKDSGLAKMSEAIELFPDEVEFLMIRGQAYLDNNEFEQACADLNLVKEIAVVKWYDDILNLICKIK